MIDVILETVPTFLIQSIDYKEAQKNHFAPWNRGGIVDFIVCHVFDTQLNNAEEQCEFDLSDNTDDEYVAYGLFGIVADEALSSYQNRIIEIMTSKSFKVAFNKNMNEKLQNITNGAMVRRLLQYESFKAIQIEVFDPFNKTNILATDKQDKNDGLNSNIIIFIGCGVLLVLVVIIIIVWKCRQKTNGKLKNEEGKYNENIEMNEHGHMHDEKGFVAAQNVQQNDKEMQDLFAELDDQVQDDKLPINNPYHSVVGQCICSRARDTTIQ